MCVVRSGERDHIGRLPVIRSPAAVLFREVRLRLEVRQPAVKRLFRAPAR